MKTNDERKYILYKDLSYKVMDILFTVQNQLGNNLQEKHYQKAVEQLLKENKLVYQKELKADLKYHGAFIGKYFLDFLIEKSIILELKAKPEIEADDIRQVYSYLKVTGLALGILANFRPKRLIYKRIVNGKAIKN